MISTLEIGTLCLVGLVLLAWYLTYTAARLHRLHTRVEGALAALDAQLVRRADAAIELANAAVLDPATSLIVAGAAADSLSAAADTLTGLDWAEPGLADRESIESDLTRALSLAVAFSREASQPHSSTPDEAGSVSSVSGELVRRLEDANRRVHLARRFYNDAVVDVRRLRESTAVRAFRLAGHAQLPRTVEFDDELGARDGADPWESGAPPRTT